MKSNKCALIIALSLFCLSLAIGIFTALHVKNSMDDNLFALSFHNENAVFSNKDIELLTRENYYFTFAAKMKAEAVTETKASEVEVIGTNACFASINKINVMYGYFFNDIHEKKSGCVAVLNSAAAWHFFGNTNCVGNNININNKPYQVIGVFESGSSQENNKQVYIPFEAFAKHGFTGNINEIIIAADSFSLIEPLIKTMGYLPEDIQVFDLEQYKNIMMQRIRIIVFLGGIYAIACFFQRVSKNIKALVLEIKGLFEENYVTDMRLLTDNKHILFELCSLIGNILLIFLIINMIKFKVYLPYYFFSINSLNYTVLNDLLNFFIQPYISVSFLRHMNGLNTVSNLMFFISILSGTTIITRLKITNKNELISNEKWHK